MEVRLTLIPVLVVFCIKSGFSQDSTFFKVGPSVGINKSGRNYERPTATFQPYAGTGFEAGLNVFYKSRGFVGFLGELTFLQTKSSMRSPDISYSTTIEERSKWLTAAGNVIFFPFPKTRKLLFVGTGLRLAYLLRSHGTMTIMEQGNPDPRFSFSLELDDRRIRWNYLLDVTVGITVYQFDQHRIVMLLAYSHMLGPFTDETTAPIFPEDYFFTNYAIGSFAAKVAMTW